MKDNAKCKYCGSIIGKDCIALNKKLLNPDIKAFACLKCLADDFDCTTEDLETKIEEFKENGCKLFE